MFNPIELEAGIEIETSPTEMSYFISQILAAGGAFYIQGNVLIITEYPKGVFSSAPEHKAADPDSFKNAPVEEAVPAEVEAIVAATIEAITEPEPVEVPLVSEELSPAEDLAAVEEAVVEEAPAKKTRAPRKPKAEAAAPAEAPVEE